MPTVTPEPIMKIAMGFMAAKFLFVASEIGLFEALASGPATLKELAERIVAPLRTVGIVSAAMVTLGLIEQEGDRYRNNAAAAAFLAGKPGHDLRPMLRYFNGLSYPQWQTLGEAVRTDKGQPRFVQIRSGAAADIFSRRRSVHRTGRVSAWDDVRFQPPSTAA
jgi:hypothetical protein